MIYATQEDLAGRLAAETLVLLADDDGDGAPDPAVIETALADASAEIDQAIGRRYVTPVANAPAIFTRWCVDLAVAGLFLRRREALSPDQAARAELTRRALTAIADGLAGLAGAQPRLEAFAADNLCLDDDPVFGGEMLESY